jgi:hypothetical protein
VDEDDAIELVDGDKNENEDGEEKDSTAGEVEGVTISIILIFEMGDEKARGEVVEEDVADNDEEVEFEETTADDICNVEEDVDDNVDSKKGATMAVKPEDMDDDGAATSGARVDDDDDDVAETS